MEEKIRPAIALSIIFCSISACSSPSNCSISIAKKVSYSELKKRFSGRVREYTKFDVKEDRRFWTFRYYIPDSFGGSTVIEVGKETCSIGSVLSTQ
jgi:hypothetical protein